MAALPAVQHVNSLGPSNMHGSAGSKGTQNKPTQGYGNRQGHIFRRKCPKMVACRKYTENVQKTYRKHTEIVQKMYKKGTEIPGRFLDGYFFPFNYYMPVWVYSVWLYSQPTPDMVRPVDLGPTG